MEHLENIITYLQPLLIHLNTILVHVIGLEIGYSYFLDIPVGDLQPQRLVVRRFFFLGRRVIEKPDEKVTKDSSSSWSVFGSIVFTSIVFASYLAEQKKQ